MDLHPATSIQVVLFRLCKNKINQRVCMHRCRQQSFEDKRGFRVSFSITIANVDMFSCTRLLDYIFIIISQYFPFCRLNILHFQETQTGFSLAETESVLTFDGLETEYPFLPSFLPSPLMFFYSSFGVVQTCHSLASWWAKYKCHILRMRLKWLAATLPNFFTRHWDWGSECHL